MKDHAQRGKTHPFLFVYGTLMRGFHGDWQKRAGAKLTGEGTIRAKLYDLGDYPGAKLADDDSENSVTGELYHFDDPEYAIRILDKYEEYHPLMPHKSLFIRELVTVTMEDGRKRSAWTYLYNRSVESSKLIPSGDYRDRVAARHSG